MKLKPPAFTIVELLTVVAIIGLLTALMMPSLVTARVAANRARTKVQFSQWAAASEAFRSEYGCYPQFGAAGLVNDGAGPGLGGDHLFHDLLAGRHRDGSPLPDGGPDSAAGQNPKLIRFHTFAESEFSANGLLEDAFGNTEIAVIVDADLDGLIKPGVDFLSPPSVHASDGTAMAPTASDFPANGLRAGVVFYAPDPGAGAGNPRFIFSWK